MYHIFIHSSVNGHLGCFHGLTIVNSAALNIVVHVSFWIMVFSRDMSRSGIDGSYGDSVFSVLRPSALPSIVAAPIYLPTDKCRRVLSQHLSWKSWETLSELQPLNIFGPHLARATIDAGDRPCQVCASLASRTSHTCFPSLLPIPLQEPLLLPF